MTLGENIADLGGTQIAYDAMKAAAGETGDPMIDHLSRDQRFFLSYATIWRETQTPEFLTLLLSSNPHAPSAWRIYGTISNMGAFATAFQCTPGSAMIRRHEDRVAIW